MLAAQAELSADIEAHPDRDSWGHDMVLTMPWQPVVDGVVLPAPPLERVAAAAYGLPGEDALDAYRARYPDATPGDLLAAVQTDWWMRVPAIRLADAHASATSGTYMYEFAWAAPGLGAVHAIEIPFVFDALGKDVRLFGPLLGEDQPQELADTMHSAWIAFATSGDPGWPRYDLNRRATMRFDTVSQVVDDPRPWERALWEGVR